VGRNLVCQTRFAGALRFAIAQRLAAPHPGLEVATFGVFPEGMVIRDGIAMLHKGS
jgi:hypothetical protein